MSDLAPRRRAGGEFSVATHFKSGMRTQNAPRQRAVSEFAAKEHGVLAHRELIELGFTASGINRWLAATPRRASRQPARAPRPIACGHSVSRTRRVDNIPVTSVARTLLDNAEVQPLRQVVRLIEQAEGLRLFDLRAIERLPRRRGIRRLDDVIAAVNGEAHVSPRLLDFPCHSTVNSATKEPAPGPTPLTSTLETHQPCADGRDGAHQRKPSAAAHRGNRGAMIR
jgi:hypothetical protein